LSKRGLIAGPNESEEAFLQRVAACCPLSQEIDFSSVEKLYNISPDWVKLIYSNKHLHLWEGACVWHDAGKPILQLRSSFKTKKRLWGLYAKQEIVDHELVHAARGQFDCPIFEEMLAYQTSTSRFRRLLGPIVRTPRESLLYLLTFFPLFAFFMFPFVQLLFFLVNLGLLTYGLLRLRRTRGLFKAAEGNVAKLLQDEAQVRFLMLHLTDEEITHFANLAPEEIREYIEKSSTESIRQQQIDNILRGKLAKTPLA